MRRTLRDHGIGMPEDLDGVPFGARVGVDGFIERFGDGAAPLLDELNRTLPA